MTRTLEDRIEEEILDSSYGIDNYDQDYIVETFAGFVAEEIMQDLSLDSDASYAMLIQAISNAINHEIDWDKVDADLAEARKNTEEWIEERLEAPNC